MRSKFINELRRSAGEDDRIFLLTGDLGFSVLEDFVDEFPQRFANAGIAEQNMTGMAAGLALSGHVVVTYSIANFSTLRCLEQIRNDVCYHNTDVKIVTVGAGFAYGTQGYTHFGIEEIASMLGLPNMKVFCPADPVESAFCTRVAMQTPGPCYIRLGGKANTIHQDDSQLRFGKAAQVRKGNDAAIFATGEVVGEALAAAQEMSLSGFETSVFSFHTLRPFDFETVLSEARRTGHVITLEEHGWGGLGTLVAETLAGSGEKYDLKIFRANENASSEIACRATILKRQGLDKESVLSALQDFVQ